MSNVQSYNALIDRFKAFASGHFILKTFSHGQIDTADLEKFTEYPFMHVVPSNVTYSKGMKTFSFQIVLADLPRDKDDKVEFQREVLSDLQRIAEDLVAEITNHRVLFGDLITVQNVTLEPFLEEFHNTLTGWTVSLDLLVPYYWDACSIPAEWNDFFESSTGGTGSILTFIDSITRDENGNVSLVNDEAEPSPNYYYGTNDEGVRGWYLLTDEVGLTCATIGTCQTIIDIEAAIDDLQEEILLKANTADISAVGFSNDYNDLDNKPTIPDVSGFVPYTGATTDVDLGTHNLTADHIALNVSPSGAGYVVGATEWNNTIGSSQTLLKGGNVSLKNGVDLVARIVNKVTPNTTLTKAAYQAVRISGAQGGRLAVALAQANNDTNSADTIGIVTETIATNQEGFILTVGQLENINTTGSLQGETWADGDVLYLSPTTAGAITNVKPTGATGHIVVIGYVEYAHAIHGKIYVKVMNGWELDELHNVYIDTPVNNNVLTYESSTSLWKNKTVATALGYTPVPETRTLTINGTTQDLSANRTFTIATGLTVGTTPITSGTVGRVLFEGTGNVLQQSGSLFWDNTNSRLGIGTAAPVVRLEVGGDVRIVGSGSTSATTVFGIYNINYQELLRVRNDGLFIFNTPSNILIGTSTNAGYKLDVNGTSRFVSSFRCEGQATFVSAIIATAQVRIGTNPVAASSVLDVQSTTQGFLPPRMTTTQKNAIASPASGLVVYDTTLGKLCVRGASAWETITSV
jgi:nitrogen fixation protein